MCQGCHGTGKTGNLKVHFSRQGKHREFAKKIFLNVFTRGIYHQHRENLSVLKKNNKKNLKFKWVELPSGCVVPGSWSLCNFGCCFVNS